MKSRIVASGLALAAGLALGLAPTELATAGTKGSAPDVVRHAAATTKAEQQRIVDYWTPERMRSAIPVGVKRGGVVERGKPTPGGSAVQETPQPRFGKVFFTLGGS